MARIFVAEFSPGGHFPPSPPLINMPKECRAAPCFVQCFTFPTTDDDWQQHHAHILEIIGPIAKWWVFQLERGAEGGLHFQGVYSLKNKKRCKEMGAIFKHGCVVTPCADVEGSKKYCKKEESRVEGPWIHKQGATKYVQRRFKDVVLRGWQEEVVKAVYDDDDDRSIHFIWDEGEGNVGKSFLLSYLTQVKGALRIPSTCQTAEDLVAAVCDRVDDGDENVVIVMDIPRAMSKKHWLALAQAIESIKSGEVYDKRYKFREVCFEPPRMLVCGNQQPPGDVITNDRWRFYNVRELIEQLDEN